MFLYYLTFAKKIWFKLLEAFTTLQRELRNGYFGKMVEVKSTRKKGSMDTSQPQDEEEVEDDDESDWSDSGSDSSRDWLDSDEESDEEVTIDENIHDHIQMLERQKAMKEELKKQLTYAYTDAQIAKLDAKIKQVCIIMFRMH